MRIVCISDTHGLQGNFPVPDGDLLIHAGDMCNIGSEEDVRRFAKWLSRLPHRWKVVVAGNHDCLFQEQPALARSYLESCATYLQDSACEIEGLRLWGSPWQPWFQDWAFNLPRKGSALQEKWNLIPFDTDVLITHAPPHGILDQVIPQPTEAGRPEQLGSGPLGCEELAVRLHAVQPKMHVFGHIHDSYGYLEQDGTLYVNASICDEAYRPVNRAVVLDFVTTNASKSFRIPYPLRGKR